MKYGGYGKIKKSSRKINDCKKKSRKKRMKYDKLMQSSKEMNY